MMSRWIAAGAAMVVAGAGGAVLATQAGASAPGTEAVAARADEATAVMKDPKGRKVGVVTFVNRGERTEVIAQFRKSRFIADGFHGFHVHANDLSALGAGCKADPDDEPATWFVSADGHLAKGGETHGDHRGDMPSVYTRKNGSAQIAFVLDKIGMSTLRGSAVMLHAGPDNFGNIPLGDGDQEYEANDDAATTLTEKTGNSGARVACGVIR